MTPCIGCCRSKRQASEKTIPAPKHGENQRLRLGRRQRSLNILRGIAGNPEQRHEKTRTVERVARKAPQRAARAAQRSAVSLVADLVSDEVEDLLRIVIQRRRLINDEGVRYIVGPAQLAGPEQFSYFPASAVFTPSCFTDLNDFAGCSL